MKKAISLILAAALVAGGAFAFVSCSKKTAEERFEKKTEYDVVKQTKKDNFTFLSEKYCRKGQTVFVGDSITEIYNLSDLFDEYTEKTSLAVYNRGISGDTSNRLLERIRENVTSIEPSNIVMLIGTNDINAGSGTELTAKNVEQILDIIKRDCPDAKVILQAIYPVNKSLNSGMVGIRTNEDIKIINEKLKALAQQKHVTFADFTELLSDENGNFNAEYTYDGLHPNAKGFAVVTQELLKLL